MLIQVHISRTSSTNSEPEKIKQLTPNDCNFSIATWWPTDALEKEGNDFRNDRTGDENMNRGSSLGKRNGKWRGATSRETCLCGGVRNLKHVGNVQFNKVVLGTSSSLSPP